MECGSLLPLLPVLDLAEPCTPSLLGEWTHKSKKPPQKCAPCRSKLRLTGSSSNRRNTKRKQASALQRRLRRRGLRLPHYHPRLSSRAQSRDLTGRTRHRYAWCQCGLGGSSVRHLSGSGLQLRESVPDTDARTRLPSDPSASVGMTDRFRLATSSPT